MKITTGDVFLFTFIGWAFWAASSTVCSQPISEHNEQQAGLSVAYDLLFADGCLRPAHSRTIRYSLEAVGEGYALFGNGLSIVCLKWLTKAGTLRWTAPPLRDDGTPQAPGEIASYEINHNGEILLVDGGTTSLRFEELRGGLHVFTFVTIDIYGKRSRPGGRTQVTVE